MVVSVYSQRITSCAVNYEDQHSQWENRNSGPLQSETPKNIETKMGLNDYVMDPVYLTNLRGNWSKGVCSPNSLNITHL